MSKLKLKFLGFVAMLPILIGCGEGGGTASTFALLFGNSSTGFGFGSGGGVIPPAGALETATLVTPEPTSMLLVGGGMMAIAYFRSKKKH